VTKKQVATGSMSDGQEERHAVRFASCMPATFKDGPVVEGGKAGVVLICISKQNNAIPLRPRVKSPPISGTPGGAPASSNRKGPKSDSADPSPVVSRSTGAHPGQHEIP
jgi:hypothetical protein